MKRILLSSIIVFVLLGAGLVVYFYPTPLIDDPEDAEVISIELFYGSGDTFQTMQWGKYADGEESVNYFSIPDGAEAEILHYLGQHKEKRTFFQKVQGVATEDVVIRIILYPHQDQSDIKTIYLGLEDFSEHNHYRSNILRGDLLLANILAALEVN